MEHLQKANEAWKEYAKGNFGGKVCLLAQTEIASIEKRSQNGERWAVLLKCKDGHPLTVECSFGIVTVQSQGEEKKMLNRFFEINAIETAFVEAKLAAFGFPEYAAGREEA